MTTRRLFLAGAASLIAARAIMRVENIMRVVMPKPFVHQTPYLSFENGRITGVTITAAGSGYDAALAEDISILQDRIYEDFYRPLVPYLAQGLTSPNRKWFTLRSSGG